MPERDLYLVAYDIAHPKRLRESLALVRSYATGGQKSVHECFLTPAEHGDLVSDFSFLLDESTDRLLVLRLDPRSRIYTLGVAAQPTDNNYFYVG